MPEQESVWKRNRPIGLSNANTMAQCRVPPALFPTLRWGESCGSFMKASGRKVTPLASSQNQVWPLLALSVAGALSGYGSGWLLDAGPSNYRWVVPAFALAGVLSAMLVLRLPVREGMEPPDRAGLWTCLLVGVHDRRFLLWTSVYSLTSIGFWVSYAATPVYFADLLQLSYRENGLTIAAHHVAFCAGFLVWGRALDRHGARAVMSASWFLIAGTSMTVSPQGSWMAVGAGGLCALAGALLMLAIRRQAVRRSVPV